ncbi:MAG: FKBP-type peptidyl-prolyl cis-trans isomerase [Bradymonadaceae bacterium]
MPIERDRVVTLTYTLRDETGELLEEVSAEAPFVYLHGYENILPRLEEALTELEPGERFEVELDPEDAYGFYDTQYQQRVSREEFPEDMELKAGMAFELIPEDHDTAELLGQAGAGLVFYVKEVGDQEVLIDANHPLAGKTLHFTGEILDVRRATDEELGHGHAHWRGTEHP